MLANRLKTQVPRLCASICGSGPSPSQRNRKALTSCLKSFGLETAEKALKLKRGDIKCNWKPLWILFSGFSLTQLGRRIKRV